MKNQRIKTAKIITNRLFLAPLSVDYAQEVFLWASDPEVTRFLRYPTHRNIDDTLSWLAVSSQSPYEFGIFLLDGSLIGSASCLPSKGGAYELGYNINKSYWGLGYGTEMATALLAYMVEQFGVSDFIVKHAVENIASQRIVEKCGFIYSKDGNYQKFDGSKTFVCREYTLHLDLFKMNIDSLPYSKIVNGTKRIEMRLNDERRKDIKVGDLIAFTNNADGSKAVVRVLALHRFSSFAELYRTLDLTKCGYAPEEVATANHKDMEAYYSLERQAQYGALGIEVQFLCEISV